MNANVRCGTIDEILDLRHRILRQGLPRSAANFDGDHEPTTVHVVAEVDGRIVGCATIVQRPWNDQPAWQLRGMAVDDGFRGTGLGAKLVQFFEEIVRNSEFSQQLWCNARSPAIGFYERCGWSVASDEFVIETAGPHKKMTRGFEKREQARI